MAIKGPYRKIFIKDIIHAKNRRERKRPFLPRVSLDKNGKRIDILVHSIQQIAAPGKDMGILKLIPLKQRFNPKNTCETMHLIFRRSKLHHTDQESICPKRYLSWQGGSMICPMCG